MEQTISQNWNLESLYAGGSQSEKLKELMTQLANRIILLTKEIQIFNAANTKKELQHLVGILQDTQNVLSWWEEVDDFLICIYAQNVKDTEVMILMDESAVIKSELTTIQSEVDRTLASLSEEAWIDLLSQNKVENYSFYIKERRQAVKDQLPLELEKMINVLSVNGFDGWEKHHDQMLTRLRIPLEIDGEKKEVSIGQALNQAIYSTERTLRQNAANAIKDVCEKNADVFASVLNRIVGFRLDVYQQRGWQNLLKEALEQNRIKEETVHTMISAINQKKDLLRAYIQRKIELEQLDRPTWNDLEFPSFATTKKISYENAVEIIIKQFHNFSEKAGSFAKKAFEAGWIEAENRPDKAEGGFCASLPIAKESRIFLTFRENYQDVITIAHELGHAYHNNILHEEPTFAQKKGTSVAETASTFMENLVLDAVINQTTDEKEKLALLELKISNGLKYIGTVPNMFQFELELYEKRKKGVLTAEEINNLMAEAEKDLYEGLIEELNVYMWMYISHFYDTEKAFYNIPYTIGYLFSNGIYALAKSKGNEFTEQYDELLRNSGRMSVEQLAHEYLEQDLTKTEFWEAALQPLTETIEEYLNMTEKLL
ncbi:M3 family oligoendopeptidase [Paenisporosarcina indica]|uniref:M3 family oligoendopeptidase n=1 Tax=Paenisporosarcina indica TaxID=650093 RepID=UPI00094FEF81|nr:M3 family oligoendopeptidase [Paenisporosarcina indica]